jgi:RNA polymerase sigma-70 factor (ECF subfamily)
MSANEHHAQGLWPRHAGDGQAAREAVKPGDFKSLYDAWAADVARWIRAMGGPSADRDDILQEVFVVVHRRLSDFDGQNLAGWLYRITAHQVRDFRRRLWFKHIFKRSVPLSDRMTSAGPTPLVLFESREKQEELDRLLAKLSEPLRTAFVLFEIEGYTGEEIATMHGTSINTVRARILRARKKLTALLGTTGT